MILLEKPRGLSWWDGRMPRRGVHRDDNTRPIRDILLREMGKKTSKDCCERYKKKGKDPCKDCPLMDSLSKKERKKLLKKHGD